MNRVLCIVGVIGLAANAAIASPIVWADLGMDESLITNGGQLFTDFGGIVGLDVTVTGSAAFDAPYVHPDTQLWYRSDEGVAGQRPVTTLNFSFSQAVSFSSMVAFFGDAGVAERITYAADGVISASSGGSVSILDNMTSSVTARSGNIGGNPTFTSAGVQQLEISLDGDDANDLAGVTVSLDITVVPSVPTAALLGVGAVFGGIRRRR